MATSQHILTKNNHDGQATFHDLSSQRIAFPMPFGAIEFIYAQPTLLPNLSAGSTSDLDLTESYGKAGLSSRRIVPDGGSSSAIITINPGAMIPVHRTRTLDNGVVIEGEVDLVVDNDESRSLKAGDTWTLRGVNHGWVNKTDKVARFYGVGIDAQSILDGRGVELSETVLPG